jgi:geranylgeranyl diphosphate synthase, type II
LKQSKRQAESHKLQATDSAPGFPGGSVSLERALNGYFPKSDRSRLNQAMRHSLFPGGKRIRPLLSLMTYRACRGKSPSAILPFACGIELIHTFSLIQDDLPSMDNDQERRGKPTLHIAFGEAVALLASDALFSRAFELFSVSTAPAGRRLTAIREIARAVGPEGIVAGQLEDITAEMSNVKCQMSNARKNSNAKRLQRIHLLKTARLIAVSLMTGGIIAGARAETVRTLDRAGVALGMLFQITDDLLDAGERAPLTCVSLYGATKARLHARRYHAEYLKEISHLSRQLTTTGSAELKAVGDMVMERKT